MYNVIILWFWKSDCSDLFWKEHLKTEPLGTLIEYPALGNPIQMILLFWSGFGGPSPASFSCYNTIPQSHLSQHSEFYMFTTVHISLWLYDMLQRVIIFFWVWSAERHFRLVTEAAAAYILRHSDACLQPSPKSNHIRCEGVNYKLWNTK